MNPSDFRPGYRRDLPHLRSQRAVLSHPLVAARLTALAQSYSLEEHEDPILNQGASGACGGHGTSQLTSTALRAAGRPLPWTPSPRRIYLNTRAYRRGQDNPSGDLPALSDGGVMAADIAQALARYGITQMNPLFTPDGRPSDVWTLADTGTVENVNQEIDAEDVEAESYTVVTGEYRIDETQPVADVAQQVAASISSLFPVGVGGFVDTAVMSWKRGDAPINSVNLNDQGGGGHWFPITSYRWDASAGLWVFRSPNSWGTSYGDAGHWELTQNALKQLAFDIYPWAIARVAQHRPAAVTVVP